MEGDNKGKAIQIEDEVVTLENINPKDVNKVIEVKVYRKWTAKKIPPPPDADDTPKKNDPSTDVQTTTVRKQLFQDIAEDRHVNLQHQQYDIGHMCLYNT